MASGAGDRQDATALVSGTLPDGLRMVTLPDYRDARGHLVELFRRSWEVAAPPVQWNCVSSPAGIMRGMHAHLGYYEYYVLLSGRTVIGYHDTRPDSPTRGAAALVDVRAADGCAIVGPPGVAHGIYTCEPTVLLVGTSLEWSPVNELGCNWRDPKLGIHWPFADGVTSERDAALPSLRELLAKVPPRGGL